MRFALFVRPNCYLCAQAVSLLAAAGIVAERLDVDSRADWQQEYGLLVPVLVDNISGKELIYPFDLQRLQAFVQAVE